MKYYLVIYLNEGEWFVERVSARSLEGALADFQSRAFTLDEIYSITRVANRDLQKKVDSPPPGR